jgi:hypothetical protein
MKPIIFMVITFMTFWFMIGHKMYEEHKWKQFQNFHYRNDYKCC